MSKKIERFIGITASSLTRTIARSLSQKTEGYVLPGSYAVIAWLMKLLDSTQGELTRLIGVEQPTMASTLARMERDGLIVREPDPKHKSKSRIKLTPLGRKVNVTMRTAAREIEATACQGISQEELDQFFSVAERMIENLATDRSGK